MARAEKRSSPRSRSERSVSIDLIVDAALVVIDRDGLDALTMRRLARERDIGVMTLYSYFGTKDELLDHIVYRVIAEMSVESTQGQSWEQRLQVSMVRLHDTLRDHPGVSAISLSLRGPVPAYDAFRESILAILHDAGFDRQSAVDAHTALVVYVMGYAIVEHARDGAHREHERQRLAGLPSADYPHLSAAADAYASHVSRGAFEKGLAALIGGLASQRSAG